MTEKEEQSINNRLTGKGQKLCKKCNRPMSIFNDTYCVNCSISYSSCVLCSKEELK